MTMSRTKFIVLILCIVLGAVGCTSGLFVDQSKLTSEEGNFYVEVEIPPGLRSSSMEGQGVVSAQGMVNLVEILFRVTKQDDPEQQLIRKITVEPDAYSVLAAFRLSEGEWYVEIVGLNDRENVVFRDEKSLDYWRSRRGGSWRPWICDDPFPVFVEQSMFDQIPNLQIVKIDKEKINKVTDIKMEFERSYVYVLLDVDAGWTIQPGSKISLEQVGRSTPYTFYDGEGSGASFVFKNPLFKHIPIGGYQMKAEIKVKGNDGTKHAGTENTLKGSAFIELYGGELTTIKFTVGDGNVCIGDTQGDLL